MEEHEELVAMALEEQKYAQATGADTNSSHLMCTTPFIPSVGMYFFIKQVVDRLIAGGYVPHMPEQLTINYYQPHQGLPFHTDNPLVIKEWVVGISLLSPCVITFKEANNQQNQFNYLLHPGTIMIQSGEVRYNWLHGIDASPTHVLGDVTISREMRVSLQLSDFVPTFWNHPDIQKLKVGSFTK